MNRDRFQALVRGYRSLLGGEDVTREARHLAEIAELKTLAYETLGEGWAKAVVMADLEQFCHAGPEQTTHVYDDPSGRESAQLEGRRQVFLRISRYSNLSPGRMMELMQLLESDDAAQEEAL